MFGIQGTAGPVRPDAQSLYRNRARSRMKKVGVGVIGCGVISGAYLKGMDSPRPINSAL
jgi:hypothetical protein